MPHERRSLSLARANRHADNLSPTGASLVPRPSLKWSAKYVLPIVGVLIFMTILIVPRALTGREHVTDWVGDPQAPKDLEAAVASLLADAPCVTETNARAVLGTRLARLGYGNWSVTSGLGVRPDACISATIDTLDRRVILIPGARPELKETIARVRAELMDRCLDREAATKLLASQLRDIGETGFDIRSDGPLAVPLDQKDEVLRHIDAGCYVYSTAGWTSEGAPIYYIAGR